MWQMKNLQIQLNAPWLIARRFFYRLNWHRVTFNFRVDCSIMKIAPISNWLYINRRCYQVMHMRPLPKLLENSKWSITQSSSLILTSRNFWSPCKLIANINLYVPALEHIIAISLYSHLSLLCDEVEEASGELLLSFIECSMYTFFWPPASEISDWMHDIWCLCQ